MSTYFDAGAVKQQYGEYETDRLMRIVLATTDEYGVEAIGLARQELIARGIQRASISRRAVPRRPSPAPNRPTPCRSCSRSCACCYPALSSSWPLAT